MVNELFGKPIYVYTRAQAIEDGALVDVSAVALRLFKFPVALSENLHADIAEIPEEVQGIDDYDVRLWDVLWMAHTAIHVARDGRTSDEIQTISESALIYTLALPTTGTQNRMYRVKLVCGPGDDMEPVLTLMRPDED
jgi:hypothetical protein